MIVVVSDNGASGEGGPERVGQRDEVRQRRARRPRAEPGDDRRAWRHEDLQPLPERLGDGIQHAVQDVEALRVQRRHERPVHHLMAGRDRRPAARSATSTTTPSTSCRRSSTCSASRRRRRSRATRRRRSTASACATASTTPRPSRRGRRSSTRCSARGRSGTRAGRPSRPIRRSPAGATSTTTSGSCTTPTSTARSCTTSRPSSPDKLREIVNIWFSEAGANGAFPLDDRTPVEILTDPRPQLDRAAGPLRVLPGRRRRCPSGRRSTSKNRSFVIGALVDIPTPGAEGVLFAHGSRFGGHALYVKDNRLHYVNNFVGSRGADGRRLRGHPDRGEPDPVGLVREGRAGADAARPARCRSTTATRRSARARSRLSSAPSRSPARRSSWAARPASRVTDDYPGEPPHAFTGGTIDRVAVDVSGEPYVDLERHAEMLHAKQQ